jgi:hypothetical protein
MKRPVKQSSIHIPSTGSTAAKAQAFKNWQSLISDSTLSRKFVSQVIVLELGMLITGTYFGPKAEFDSLDIASKFPQAASANDCCFH